MHRSLALVEVASSKETSVELSPGGCADAVSWAGGKRFALRNTALNSMNAPAKGEKAKATGSGH